MVLIDAFRRFHLIVACVLLAAGASAQPPGGSKPVDIVADSLEYLAEKKLMIGTGNVVVRDGDDSLSADYMTVQTETQDVYARGNVVYRRGDQIWRGEELRYNMRTRMGDFGAFSAFYDPFFIVAGDSRREGTNSYFLKDVEVTTCEGDDPAVSIRAREATIIDNRLRAKGVTFYAAGVIPYFWLPSYTRSLDAHERFFQFVPGYNSRMGPFLLTAYNYPLFGEVRGITRLDLRGKRGLAVGQDFTWKDRVDKTYEGSIAGYYLNDDDPLNGPDSEARSEELIDEERYRIRLKHYQRFTDRDYLIGDLNYLSDPFIIQDFFNKEFRGQVQPENRVTLTHRDDNYTAAIQLNKRLNDFYENVDRLPELSLDLPRQQLFDTDLFYESRSAMSYLERVFPEGGTTEDYDSFRFDTGHTLYYPTRHFGFLNLIPRAGYRGTYYSTTFSSRTESNDFVSTDEFGVVTVTNQVRDIQVDEGGDLRNVFQLGWEASFKAFRTWDDLIVLNDGDGLRHVVEPYLDHTYQPEPDLLPFELPQFDSVDTIGERHDIKLGLRNKLQTRRNRSPVDIIDLDVFTFYRVEIPEGEEEDFSDIFFDANINLARRFPVEFDGAFDAYESEVTTFNALASYLMDDGSTIGLDYRYRIDRQDLGGLNINLFPLDRWSFEAGFRMDFEESELEEQYYFVKHTGQCLGWGLGYREVIDDSEEIWFQLWLTAFPDALIDVGY